MLDSLERLPTHQQDLWRHALHRGSAVLLWVPEYQLSPRLLCPLLPTSRAEWSVLLQSGAVWRQH